LPPPPAFRVVGLTGFPDVQPGDNLAALTIAAIERSATLIEQGDVFVCTQKVVSKAEDRLVRLDEVSPSTLAREWAAMWLKDPRVIELVLRDAVRIVRMERGVLITETAQGLICANAGVDTSNIRPGWAARLPADPDASARALCSALRSRWNLNVGVIISDTFGRPWREGQTNVAIGVAGVRAILDYRGSTDTQGQPLRASAVAVADEIAAAAELVMGKTCDIPVALIQGIGLGDSALADGTARDLLRHPEEDLFR
jgi:coenzyme F420-0:L-glutamate ligase/coenzyme F420-1:gamma-L-glutamate ligase